MRFLDSVNPTVLFGCVINPTVHGSVRFSSIGDATVRFGAALESRKYNGAVRLFLKSSGADRCGFPIS